MNHPPSPPPMLVPYLAAAGAALSAVFLLLPFNERVFLAINSGNHPMIDPVALTVTMVGDGAVLSMLLLVVARYSAWRALAGISALILAGVAAQLLKFSADIPRPGAALTGIHMIGPALMARSFPSGHSAAAFAVAGVFLLASRSVTGALFPLAVAAAVAWSRIYIGVHYPADAAMGAFLGLAAAGLVTAAIGRSSGAIDGWGRRNRGSLSLGSAVLYVGAGLWLLTIYPELPGTARIPLAIAALVGFPLLFGGYSRISRR